MSDSLMRMSWIVKSCLLESWRKKETLVLGILLVLLVTPLLLVDFFNTASPARLIIEMTLLLIWIFSMFLTVSVGQRSIGDEFTFKTINPLLAKPVSRVEVVLGKFIGAGVVVGTALGLMYTVAFSINIFSGFNASLVFWIQAFWLHLVGLLMLLSLVLLGSVFLSKSLNVTLSYILVACCWLFGEKVVQGIVESHGPVEIIGNVLVCIMPHIQLFDIRKLLIHSWDPLAGWVVLWLTGYAFLYTFIGLALTVFKFKRVRS